MRSITEEKQEADRLRLEQEERTRISISKYKARYDAWVLDSGSRPVPDDPVIDPSLSLGDLRDLRDELTQLKTSAVKSVQLLSDEVRGARSAGVAVRRRLEQEGADAAACEVEYPGSRRNAVYSRTFKEGANWAEATKVTADFLWSAETDLKEAKEYLALVSGRLKAAESEIRRRTDEMWLTEGPFILEVPDEAEVVGEATEISSDSNTIKTYGDVSPMYCSAISGNRFGPNSA